MNRFAQSTRGPEWFEGRSCRSAGYRTDYRSRLPQGVPHRIRTFTFSPDPDFEAKLLDIVGLYLNPPENAFVLKSRSARFWHGARVVARETRSGGIWRPHRSR